MLFQFLPRLSDDEYAALEKSILEHGIQVPILVDENKSVIDGHHRKEIADRLGLECPRRFAMDLDETQKRTLALSLNLDRRHLNREQKRELIEKSLKADPQLSNVQHAKRTGASDKTVQAARSAMEATSEIPRSNTRVSADGRSRPALQPVESTVNTETGEVSDDYVTEPDYVTDQVDLDAPFAGAGADEIEEAFAAAREQEDVSHLNVVNNLPQRSEPVDHVPFQQQAPKARRRPLTDAFRENAYKLGKLAESMERLVTDDRFPQNAEKVATANRHDLIRQRDRLNRILDALPEIH